MKNINKLTAIVIGAGVGVVSNCEPVKSDVFSTQNDTSINIKKLCSQNNLKLTEKAKRIIRSISKEKPKCTIDDGFNKYIITEGYVFIIFKIENATFHSDHAYISVNHLIKFQLRIGLVLENIYRNTLENGFVIHCFKIYRFKKKGHSALH